MENGLDEFQMKLIARDRFFAKHPDIEAKFGGTYIVIEDTQRANGDRAYKITSFPKLEKRSLLQRAVNYFRGVREAATAMEYMSRMPSGQGRSVVYAYVPQEIERGRADFVRRMLLENAEMRLPEDAERNLAPVPVVPYSQPIFDDDLRLNLFWII